MAEFTKSYTIVVFILTGLSTATKQKRATSYNLQLEINQSALQYLAIEMSEMVYVKSSLLRPFMVERVAGTSGNKAVQEHIKFALKNWHIEEDTFTDTTPYGEKNFTNIIATFDPSKPTKIVLACHFDSKYIPNERFLGATDSAVPCVILLETVRQLQCLLEKRPESHSATDDWTLQLIFFDGEEAFKYWSDTDSIYGARHLANRWAVEKDPVNNNNTKLASIMVFILLDLIGTLDTIIPQQMAETAELYQHLVKTEQHLRANDYLTGNHASPIFNGELNWGSIQDDHLPFQQRGVSIVHLISSPFPSVWHQVSDDFDHLDFDLIDDFSRIFRVFISDLMKLQPENRGCRKK